MKEQIKGINTIGDAMGLNEHRKKDLQEIVFDRLFRGYSTKETLQRSIARKMKHHTNTSDT